MNYLDNLKSNLCKHFAITTDYSICNVSFDIHAILESFYNKQNIILMNKTTKTLSYEIVLAKTLNSFAELENLLEIITFIEQNQIDTKNPAHSFSFISIYLFCDNLSKEEIRKIKKFRYEKNYKINEFGFLSTRLCVACGDKIYTNALGKDIKFRIHSLDI